MQGSAYGYGVCLAVNENVSQVLQAPESSRGCDGDGDVGGDGGDEAHIAPPTRAISVN